MTATRDPGVPAIPFNRPSLEGREIEYIRAAIAAGHSSASGPFSARAAAILREEIQAQEALLTTSCTAALELSALLLDIQPGDTVIVPSFTFVTTALAFAREGATLRFADIEGQRLGIDPAHVDALIDDSVRAVVAVHYAGIPCDLDGLGAVLQRHEGVALIEDNAHGLFARHRGQPLGSFGRFGTLSFHETKNFHCGEGGALLLNQSRDVDRARIAYDKGTDRLAFLHGLVDKYSWQDIGSSFGLSDVLAAYLLGQLEQRATILEKRSGLYRSYEGYLGDQAAQFGYRLPIIPNDCIPAYHMFYVLMPDQRTRDRTLAFMRDNGVNGTFHYVPLHSSAGAKRFTESLAHCPTTDDISGRLIRLPFFNSQTKAQVNRTVDVFLSAQDG